MAVQWITTTPISGSSGTTQVSVVPQNNTGATTRTGVITVTASRFGRTKTVEVNVSQKKEERDYSKMYFTTRSLANSNRISFTIPSAVTSSQATSMSYSTDNGNTWTTTMVDGTSKTITVSGLSSGQTVLWKGVADGWGKNADNSANFNSNGNYEVEGNIMSLLYGDNFSGQTTLNIASAFSWMFYYSELINAENLVLPATTLSETCYGGMFNNCNYLTKAPELPATTLAKNCYNGMFGNCSSLTTAPELPATTLANACYRAMFLYCTSLTATPELPVTTLAERCYEQMFRGCTGLTTAPELPALTLNEYCYNFMFSGCTSLATPPVLPATTLATACYNGMFRDCTSLTTTPSLPVETLASYCYNSMFKNCISITIAPTLPATTLATACYDGMFQGCTSLTTVQSALPATTVAQNCYSSMFQGCTSLTAAPELPATTLANSCYSYMFAGCTSLNYIKCLATDKSALGSTSNWVSGVSSSGTFEKASGITWSTGASGIPSGWTVIDAS